MFCSLVGVHTYVGLIQGDEQKTSHPILFNIGRCLCLILYACVNRAIAGK